MKRFLRMIFVVVALSLIVAAPSYSAEPSKQADMMKNMRRYVLVVLKTGPTRVEDKQARAEMFQGHFCEYGKAGEGWEAIRSRSIYGWW